MRQLTAGSLFSGIGGIDLAFALAGFNILFQVEIDEFCRKVLAKHASAYWPEVQIYADVHDVGRHNLSSIDVLFGGFPCQSISNAGKRDGIQPGSKSGLWLEFKRVIGELRPRVVFLENVAAITSRDGVKVIGDLTALGYDARWGVISASDAGAPHLRERWWCVAHTDCDRREEHNAESIPQREVSTVGRFGANESSSVGYTSGQRCEERHITTKPETPRFGAWQSDAVDLSNRKRQQEGGFARVGTASHIGGEVATEGLEAGRLKNKSTVGGAVDGLSERLDGRRLMAHQWPAIPLMPQIAGEAPYMAVGNQHTVSRIRALGNAVVPQCVYPMAVQIADLLTVLP